MNKKGKILLVTITLCIIVVLKVGAIVQSQARPMYYDQDTKITSVKIEFGDTIWDIAKRYYSSDFGDFTKYVDSIISMNNLTDDTIHYGNYLIVPCK